MRTIPDQIKAPPVKIAIIDDGVDVSHLSLDGTIATGKSFCPYAHSTDLMNSYYVPSGNHGTCMATLIRKICPEISFYVARLDERHVPGSGQRQITAKSAADVRGPSQPMGHPCDGTSLLNKRTGSSMGNRLRRRYHINELDN